MKNIITLAIGLIAFGAQVSPAADPPATPWSCSAYCLLQPYAGGAARVSGPKTSDGETAGQAFAKLDKICRDEQDFPGLHTVYYAGLVQWDGSETTPATLRNSCLH